MTQPQHATPSLPRAPRLQLLAAIAAVLAAAPLALAQTAPPTQAPQTAVTKGGAWQLFWDSADIFTLALVVGSVIAVAVMVRCLLEIRERRIIPADVEARLRELLLTGDITTVRDVCERDTSVLAAAVLGALNHPADDREGMREAAELAASESCATWFRKVEPLGTLGQLGPLVGLAGTVWGMIIAFAALGESSGRAGPADLSLGISKALFHTLLGLLLAVPALGAHSLFKGAADRLCTRALVVGAELVELLPTDAHARGAKG